MHDDLYTEMAALEDRFWWFVAKRNILLNLIGRYAPARKPGEKGLAIDLGCGSGGLLRRLKDSFPTLGVEMNEHAREICAEHGLTVKPGWLPDDVPAEDASADVIVMSDVLEHVEKDVETVKVAAQKLRPGGILVCTVPAHPWMWTKRDEHHNHFRRYTRDQYERMFDIPELAAVVESYYNSFLFPPMVAARLLGKVLKKDTEAGDIRVPPGPVNGAMRRVFECEKQILGKLRLPIGASLISVHRRV
ncbi:MAG: class I SAM-dependent methyltransferase [Phycisphaera sp.]|nr:MAG: class I SAM-dependent methyltransferase [Phycisphaera sp.]